MIDHAISKQLQADLDIKIGVFLLGGLGSSIIAAAASKHRKDITAFTIGTEITPDVEAARVVAKHLDIRLIESTLDPGDLKKRLPEARPVMESFNVVTAIEGILTMELSRTAALERVKVILSGEGADELFADYDFMRTLEPTAQQASRKILLANIGNTECKRLDRASMAFSVEARVPFLDCQLVEWAMSLQSYCLIRQTGDRLVCRSGYRRKLSKMTCHTRLFTARRWHSTTAVTSFHSPRVLFRQWTATLIRMAEGPLLILDRRPALPMG